MPGEFPSGSVTSLSDSFGSDREVSQNWALTHQSLSLLFTLISPPVPLQGVHYLVENHLLEWRAESVAEFLYKEEGLNKTAIGNFLGEWYSRHTHAVINVEAALRRKHLECADLCDCSLAGRRCICRYWKPSWACTSSQIWIWCRRWGACHQNTLGCEQVWNIAAVFTFSLVFFNVFLMM